ncbi:MAG: ABC transporter ATP-binding protein [Thermodesulfobacteriota bacterium]
MFLDVNSINTFYDVFHAIFDVSLCLDKGEVVCLLGRNGAGKTTTLTSIVGLKSPRSGSVTLKGIRISGKRAYQIARMGVGYVPENRWIISELTVRDNLELGCRRKTDAQRAVALEGMYELFPRLKELGHRVGGTLSGGEQQMLALARALVSKPELLLMDEVTIGLAPLVVQMLKSTILTLKQNRNTILLTEQNALFALDVSDRVYVIDKGTIVYDGTVDQVRQEQTVMSKYLGL